MHHVGDCNAMFRAGSALLLPEDALVVRQKAQHKLIDHLYLHLHARVTVGWLRAAEAPNQALPVARVRPGRLDLREADVSWAPTLTCGR